jgi:peptidoglycan/LPS O-acetylase OafA/YrhL
MDMKASPSHLPGFDWLRAIFICLVVLAHLNVFELLAVGMPAAETCNRYDVIRFQVVYLAVPGFLLIATFLQSIKQQSRETHVKHFTGLVYLYLFWVAAWTLATHVRPDFSPWGLVTFVLRGGGWAFYFFAELLIIQVVRAVISNWKDRSLWLGLLATLSLIAVGFAILFKEGRAWTVTSTYWWPICFLPVPFIAHLLARSYSGIVDSTGRMLRVVGAMALVTVVFGICEWRFAASAGTLEGRPFLPEYLRVSTVLGAACVVLASLRIRAAPRLVRFISRNSLGIFCIHVFVLSGVYRTIAAKIHDPLISSLITCLVILFGGACIAEILRRCMKSRLV